MSNKGGELMLRAAVQELRPDFDFVVEPWVGPYQARAALGLYQKLWIKRLGPAAGLPGHIVPARMRSLLGIRTEAQISGILDVSGFAYGDAFGAKRTEVAARSARRWRRAGKALILLPQAFGPFSGTRIRSAARDLLANADLVFARDSASLEAIWDLGVARGNIALAPDFTLTVPAIAPDDNPTLGPHAYIVPNVKVTRQSNVSEREYLEFLLQCATSLRERSLRVRLLIHESAEDAALASRIRDADGSGIELVHEEDPQRLKGLIAKSTLIVASRFHALVAALSQGVPVVAVGWSHKYDELLNDYGCPEALVALPALPDALEAVFARLLDDPARSEVVRGLINAAEEQKNQTRQMWLRVRQILNERIGNRPAAR